MSDLISKEEAITLIKSAQLMLINPTTNEPVSDLYEALDMAIKALEQNEKAEEWYKLFVEKLDEQEPCEDAISREAVIKLAYDMSEIDGEHFSEPCMVVDVEDIQKLSSVIPIVPSEMESKE